MGVPCGGPILKRLYYAIKHLVGGRLRGQCDIAPTQLVLLFLGARPQIALLRSCLPPSALPRLQGMASRDRQRCGCTQSEVGEDPRSRRNSESRVAPAVSAWFAIPGVQALSLLFRSIHPSRRL